MPESAPELIYKIATRDIADAARAAGVFAGMPIDTADGYLHFSTAAQLAETLRLHFRGMDDVIIFAVRTAGMGAALRWEPSRRGDLFPHLYGTFPMAAVAHEARVAVDDSGNVELPEWVR